MSFMQQHHACAMFKPSLQSWPCAVVAKTNNAFPDIRSIRICKTRVNYECQRRYIELYTVLHRNLKWRLTGLAMLFTLWLWSWLRMSFEYVVYEYVVGCGLCILYILCMLWVACRMSHTGIWAMLSEPEIRRWIMFSSYIFRSLNTLCERKNLAQC